MSTHILKKIDIKSILSVGLDVSKSKIDVCILLSNENEKDICLQIANSKKWITDFISLLKENNCSKKVPFIIESTGDYNTLACLLFSETWFNIKEINPIITRNYVKHTIRWTKTDKTDAKALAGIGLQNRDELFTFNKSKKFIEINKKVSLVSNLETQLQSLKRTLHSFDEIFSELELEVSWSIKDIQLSIQELEEKIKKFQQEIQDTSIWEDADKKVEIINSITGVSKYMAQVFYASFAHKDFTSKESMYAFVGYDPKLKDSGTFVGKACISKRWNAYVRKKLFQSAFCAVQHSKIFKDIYEKHKQRWKHHFVCVIAVVKKMIYIMFSLLKNNSRFNPNFGIL